MGRHWAREYGSLPRASIGGPGPLRGWAALHPCCKAARPRQGGCQRVPCRCSPRLPKGNACWARRSDVRAPPQIRGARQGGAGREASGGREKLGLGKTDGSAASGGGGRRKDIGAANGKPSSNQAQVGPAARSACRKTRGREATSGDRSGSAPGGSGQTVRARTARPAGPVGDRPQAEGADGDKAAGPNADG